MGKQVRQLLGAFVLGTILPTLLLNLSGMAQSGPIDQPQPTQTQQTQSGTELKTLPVLMEDGRILWMELEEYITGVVLGEMPADFEMEALKAQAVVARTYALKRQEEGSRHPFGAVCVDPGCCQSHSKREAYLAAGGTQADIDRIQSAVEQTAGQVLLYEDQLIEATYFSCSGGKTENAVAVWGTDVPYLQAVVSPGEEGSPKYMETVHFDRVELTEALGVVPAGPPGQWLSMLTYTEGGGVGTAVIAGKCFSGVQLRSLLNLNSTAFTVSPEEDGLSFTTYGHGHRVGMSQYGADAMAVQGNNHEQILFYYYHGTRIDKIDALG